MQHRVLVRLGLAALAAALCAPLFGSRGNGNYLLIDQAGIDAATARAQSQPWAAKALQSLLRDADRAMAAKLEIPDRGGQWPHWYSCKKDGVRLRTESPTVHRCPHCNAVYTGEPFDSVPAYWTHGANASAARDLGLAFRFTGKEEYAQRAVALLTGYADRYNAMKLHDRFGEAKVGGGHIMAQTLDESVWLIPMAWSYALVRDTMDAAARSHVEKDLFLPAADVIRQHKMGIHNIQCWKNTAVGLAGFVSGNKELIAEAIDDPDRGFRVQIEKGVKDGIWWEGSLGYHTYTMQSLWPLTEAAKLAGTDLYNDAYRSLYDGPLAVALPNGDAPGFNDNAGANVSRMASLYELAYARWKQPEFGKLVADSGRDSLMSLLWGSAEVSRGDPVPKESKLLPAIGFAMLRSSAMTVAVRFGSHGGGHGHPDKLNVVSFGGGRLLGMDPGSINYGVPLHQEWYRATIAHNTVSVDGASQSTADGKLVDWKGNKLVASAPGAYKGVTLTRSLELNAAGRISDRFECVSDAEHVYDWAFHVPGKLTVSVPVSVSARADALGTANGYQHLKKLSAGRTDGAWSARFESGSGPALVLHVEAAPGTEVFTGVGPGRDPVDEVPVLIVRRRAKSATFAVMHQMESQRVSVEGPASAALEFGAAEIRRALAARNAAGLSFVIATGGTGAAQSYSLRKSGTVWRAVGADAAGAMYGALDLAEQIRTGLIASAKDSDSKPHIANRGIKFNIPLDARTPSYSDNSDAAQGNIPEMWSMDFWREFLDDMARHRYNTLSLWNLHPFPSMVKVPEYPDVALTDVMRTTHPLDDTYSLDGKDMVRPEILAKLQPVKRMTIDEKIRFWRDVMQYAQDRGVSVYVFTWNIFTWGAEGKHGITRAQNNQTTIDYFRKSVREMVLTYPLLAGMGITAGENMETRADEFDKEKWLWKTYGEGIRDALKQQPGREFRLIHRFHQTALGPIKDEFKDYPGPFDLSFKYSIAHMLSIPKPVFIDAALPYLSPQLRTWLTVRNDDVYSFRWADPDYAREYIRNIPGPDKVAGFYMGPDGFIWGRDFLGKEVGAKRQTVMQKQWFSFLLWGRLSYDPSLPQERLEAIVAERFTEVPAKQLLSAWAEGSRVFAGITRFSWGDIDLRWFPEACISHPTRYKGFYTVRHFMEGGTMPGANVLDVLTWRARLRSGEPMEGTTPLQIAAALRAQADRALPAVATMRGKAKSAELRATLSDIEAMSHLANYYGEKILGAADLALFDGSGDVQRQKSAVAHLEAAAGHWRKYAAAYSAQYKPMLLNRVGFVDIPGLISKVEADVAMAQGWKQGTLKEPDPRGRRGDNPFKP